jgi:hypothetical protein
MRQGGKLTLSPAQHPTRQNSQKLRPFGPNLRFSTLEISRSLDCLVRIAVLSEAVSLEIPCSLGIYSVNRHFCREWLFQG